MFRQIRMPRYHSYYACQELISSTLDTHQLRSGSPLQGILLSGTSYSPLNEWSADRAYDCAEPGASPASQP